VGLQSELVAFQAEIVRLRSHQQQIRETVTQLIDCLTDDDGQVQPPFRPIIMEISTLLGPAYGDGVPEISERVDLLPGRR
jgi:hypothetical protein